MTVRELIEMLNDLGDGVMDYQVYTRHASELGTIKGITTYPYNESDLGVTPRVELN